MDSEPVEEAKDGAVALTEASPDSSVEEIEMDTGLIAWLQVVGGFFTLFNSWGVVNTFGAYQTYYKLAFLSDVPDSTISWIGSIQGFIALVASIITGRLLDAGYLRHLVFAGTFLVTFGMMMASISKEFYQLFLSQGVCVGLACSCLYIAAIGAIVPYFQKKRGLALGIAAAGSSLGGVIYPIMVHKLIPRLGFAWATRILAFTIFGTCLIPCLVLRPRFAAKKNNQLLNYESFRDVPYLLFSLGTFLGFAGIYVPLFYVQSYAISKGMSQNLAFYLVPMLNALSIFGRILPNMVADSIGPVNALIPCIFSSAILSFSWIAITTNAGIMIFSMLFGFFTGSFVSLPPACIASLTKDLSVVGSRIGMSFCLCGFGVLMGPPVAGALLTRDNGQYLFAQVFSGAFLCAGSICVTLARFIHAGPKILKKC